MTNQREEEEEEIDYMIACILMLNCC